MINTRFSPLPNPTPPQAPRPALAPHARILALDSSTERLTLALGQSDPAQPWAQPAWSHNLVGGAQASAQLLPALQDLLRQAQWQVADLDAIVFGAGPGAFTGLRTACAVAQGLGFAHRIPLLGVPSLLAMAWSAYVDSAGRSPRVAACLDARMQEWYVACVDFGADAWWQTPLSLIAADALQAWQAAQAADLVVLGDACPPHAAAMWQMAPQLAAAGLLVSAAQAAPVYVRNRVAQTTAERLAAKNIAQLAADPSTDQLTDQLTDSVLTAAPNVSSPPNPRNAPNTPRSAPPAPADLGVGKNHAAT